MKQHKPGCMANVACAVYHADGVCLGPYGKCTCDVPPPTSTTEMCDCLDNHKNADVSEATCSCCENNHLPPSTPIETEWEARERLGEVPFDTPPVRGNWEEEIYEILRSYDGKSVDVTEAGERIEGIIDSLLTTAKQAGRDEERKRIIELAGGEPYLYVPNIEDIQVLTEAKVNNKRVYGIEYKGILLSKTFNKRTEAWEWAYKNYKEVRPKEAGWKVVLLPVKVN